MASNLLKDSDYLGYLGQLEQQNNLPQGILASQMKAESSGNSDAVGPQTKYGQALGPFQILPSTAQDLGVDPTDPMQAAQGAAKYLAQNVQKYGDVPTALAAYNWGPGNISKFGVDNAPEETKNYVSKILNGVGNFIVPSAQAAESDTSPPPPSGAVSIAAASTASSVPPPPPGAQPIGNIGTPAQYDQTTSPFFSDYSASAVQPTAISPLSYAQSIPGIYDQQSSPLPPDPTAYVASPPDNPSFLNRVNRDETSRFQKALDAYGKYDSGQQNALNTGFQMLGNTAAGVVGDVGAEGLKSLYHMLPQGTQDTINQSVSGLANYTGLTGLAHDVSQGWDSLAQKYPTTMSDVSAANNMLMLAPMFSAAKGTGTALAGVGDALKGAVPDLGAVAADTAAADTAAMGRSAAQAAAPAAKAVDAASIPATSGEMGELANASYKQADDLGGTVSPQGTNKIINVADKSVPQTEVGKKIFGDSETTKLVQRLQSLRDKPLSLAEAQELDEGLSEKIDDLSPLGKPSKQATKLMNIQNSLRDTMINPADGDLAGGTEGFQALQQGRQYWAQMMKMRDLERIQANAELSDNPAQAIRSAVRTILKNKSKSNFYNQPGEIAALKNASKTGLIGEALRGVGSRLTQYAAGGAGFAAGGPVSGLASGAAAHFVSGAARDMAQTLQNAKLNDALKTIAKNTTPKVRK